MERIEVPDLSQNGTITFTMDWNAVPLDNGSLSIYKIGDIVENNGNYQFELIDKLKSNGLSLDNLEDRELAKELAKLAKKEKLTEITALIKDGKAQFADVAPGLYIVMQEEEDVTEGFAAINPFLISMPKYENGHYEINVIANPKVSLESVPTKSETAKSTDSILPQTGQLNWPIPLLTVSGLLVFALGWCFRFGRKKENYEK